LVESFFLVDLATLGYITKTDLKKENTVWPITTGSSDFFGKQKKLGDFWETIFLILLVFKGKKNHTIFNQYHNFYF